MHSQGTTSGVCRQDMKFTTRHGFLVALGWVAERLGLSTVLERRVQIKQKVFAHKPVEKVVEALVGILGDCRYMKDLNFDPEPIVSDQAVARAWGQEKFAHFSTVCATFGKFTAENVEQLSEALAEVQAPLLREEVEAVAGPDRQGLVVVDIDLTGQKVRGEAKQYTGTDFGYIQGKLARGYQIAAAFLSGRQDRFAIAGSLKSGKANAQSHRCLLELVPTVEARIGRPRRRVEWVEACLVEHQARIRRLEDELAALHGRGSGPKRQRCQREIQETTETIAALTERLDRYRQENAANPSPLRIVLRADSAFGTAEVIQQLLELGYELAMKSFSGSNAAYKPLFDAVPAEQWAEVEKNRFATEAVGVPRPALLGDFPLRLIALRRWDGDGREARSVLLTTFSANEMPLREVVHFYHRRQTIEAGFQEWKGTFHFGTPRLRKYEANAAFTQLVLFAFNLVRWAWRFLSTPTEKLQRAKSRLLIRVAARCRATIYQAGGTFRLLFGRGTPLTGAEVIFSSPLGQSLAVSLKPKLGCSRDT